MGMGVSWTSISISTYCLSSSYQYELQDFASVHSLPDLESLVQLLSLNVLQI